MIRTAAEKKFDAMRLEEMAAAMAEATEQIPVARAALAEAAEAAVRCTADRVAAVQGFEAAEAALAVAMRDAVTLRFEDACKRWSAADAAVKVAALRRLVAGHREDLARSLRDSRAAGLASAEAISRGYGPHLARLASDWVAATDLRGLVRRGRLDGSVADVLRQIAAGSPVLDGARVFAEIAAAIGEAEMV
jgi:hypothetical protein